MHISDTPPRITPLVVATLAIFIGALIALGHPVLVMAVLILAAACRWPVEIALGLFALSVPFDTIAVLGGATTISWVAGAFAGLLLAITGLVSGRLHFPPAHVRWWALFVVWSLCSVLWAWDRSASREWVVAMVSMPALFILLCGYRFDRTEVFRIAYFALAGGIIAASVLLLQGGASFEGRSTITFGERTANPNDLAISLLLPFSVALGACFAAHTLPRRIFFGSLATLLSAGALFTLSRTFLVALAVAAVSLLYRMKVRAGAIIVIVAVLLPLPFLPTLFYERLKEAPTSGGAGRVDIYVVGAEIIKHQPVFGVGFGNFAVAYQQYAGAAPVFRGSQRAAHNSYLQIWAETGIIGLCLFIGALGSQVKKVRRIASSPGSLHFLAAATEATLYALLVAALFGSIHLQKSFWLALMMIAIVQSRAAEEQGAEAAPPSSLPLL